ncbi:MAG: DNA-directed RNA polymerase subunit alpha [Verrucomicrobiota bacterium]
MSVAENFTMPVAIRVQEETATPTYACIVAEPWEKGFGHTMGNALRRVLRGVAVSSMRIDGVAHEFSGVPDVIEDVTEIALNLKELRVRCDGELPRTLHLYADKAGDVTAASIKTDGVTEIVNPDLHICTIDKDRTLHMELEISEGRGYRPAEENKREEQPIGVIPMDCIFSPVERVRYDVAPCRVGNRTDYDSLELEVWTDGRVQPEDAVRESAALLREHLTVFIDEEEEEPTPYVMTEEDKEQLQQLLTPVDELELSIRAKNCLSSAGVNIIGQLVEIPEADLLEYRNFGKKSLEEIKKALAKKDFHLGMVLRDEIRDEMHQTIEEEAARKAAEAEEAEETEEAESGQDSEVAEDTNEETADEENSKE